MRHTFSSSFSHSLSLSLSLSVCVCVCEHNIFIYIHIQIHMPLLAQDCATIVQLDARQLGHRPACACA